MHLLISFLLIASLLSSSFAEEKRSGGLIVGGTEVPVGKYNFTVGFRSTPTGTNFCGGTVIAPRYVLTAAHCASYIKYVSLGSHYFQGKKDGVQMKVANVTVHPQYGKDTRHSLDFAIVELPKATNVSFALLANTNKSDDTGVATVAGWGTTSEGGEQSDVLLEVDVAILDNKKCQEMIQNNGDIDDSMLCAGGKAGEDSCQGDSGGPLIVRKNDTNPILVGVVSWGIGCARENSPGVYSRVSQVKDFIDAHVKGHKWH